MRLWLGGKAAASPPAEAHAGGTACLIDYEKVLRSELRFTAIPLPFPLPSPAVALGGRRRREGDVKRWSLDVGIIERKYILVVENKRLESIGRGRR